MTLTFLNRLDALANSGWHFVQIWDRASDEVRDLCTGALRPGEVLVGRRMIPGTGVPTKLLEIPETPETVQTTEEGSDVLAR